MLPSTGAYSRLSTFFWCSCASLMKPCQVTLNLEITFSLNLIGVSFDWRLITRRDVHASLHPYVRMDKIKRHPKMPLNSMDYLLKYSAIHGKYRNPAITAIFRPNTIVHAKKLRTGLFSIVLIKFFIISFPYIKV